LGRRLAEPPGDAHGGRSLNDLASLEINQAYCGVSSARRKHIVK
jgi:hypothetical protein